MLFSTASQEDTSLLAIVDLVPAIGLYKTASRRLFLESKCDVINM